MGWICRKADPADERYAGGRARCPLDLPCGRSSQIDYFANWNSGEGTQPSLPSSSLTFHQILSFSPVG